MMTRSRVKVTSIERGQESWSTEWGGAASRRRGSPPCTGHPEAAFAATRGRSVGDDDAAVDRAAGHLVEDLVDLVELAGRHGGMDLAAGVEVECLHHVLAGADDR